MRRLIPFASLYLALIAACSAGAGASGPTASTASDEPDASATTPSPRPSLTLASRGPTKVPGPETRFSGVLSMDAIEGGCAYLQAVDGRRLEVLYPEGWRLQKSPLELIAPDGSVHSRAGDIVSVLGSEADDMASICQIGPIVRATEVLDR